MYEEHQIAADNTREPPVDASIPDPLREVRDLKRRVQIGVYSAILASEPFYYFVLNFTFTQLLTGLGVGLLIAFTAIEFAFHEVFKLRRRSSYPGVLVMQLGGVQSSAVAYQTGLAVVGQLLKLSSSFLCLYQGDSLGLAAFSGIGRLETDQLIRLGAADVRKALEAGTPVRFQPGPSLLAEAVLPPGQTLIFIPVRSLQRITGFLAIIAADSNEAVKDSDLLAGMGFALGLSLENLRQREDLQELAAMDELTGVYNRRYFMDELNRELAFASRYGTPLAVAILDLDGLKAINDTFGHVAGDEVLRAVALRLVRYSRASDLVARMGGDEFALILPRTDAQAAKELGSRLQWAVEQHPVALADGQDLSVAISCGAASFPEDADDAEALLRRADAVMYCIKAARRQGANP